jgi:AcrR family transcriptional regulator
MRDMESKHATRRDMRREATKASVLEAAQGVFLDQGFQAATIKTIADRAGVSPGTVLNAEPTKAALLVAILQRESEQIAEAVEQLAGALAGPTPDRLDALLHLMLDGHLKHTELFAAAIGHSWLDGDDKFQRGFEGLGSVWAPVRRVLKAGISSGDFRADLPEAAAMQVLADVFYSAVREAVRGAGSDPHEMLSSRLAVMLDGFKP